MTFIDELMRTADEPEKIRALHALIVGRHGWDLFSEIERVKIALTSVPSEVITFNARAIHIEETLTRPDFEAIIDHLMQKIGRALEEIEKRAGVHSTDIDAVLRVGGSAQLPAVIRLLAGRYGTSALAEVESFTGVAAGLGFSPNPLEE
jgi:hypothetical chaperone protein